MVWAGILYDHKTKIYLKPKKTRIDSLVYQDILDEYVIPFLKLHETSIRTRNGTYANIYFQQDNAPAHVSKSTMQYFR
jgi:hypothetical protein